MKLSVVIPVYNEIKFVQEIVKQVKALPIKDLEIIMVDDFSTDGTREILKNEMEGQVDKILYHERNKGKGAAVRTAFPHATGDYVIVQDADLEYDPQDYLKMIKVAEEKDADVVYGSRYMTKKADRILGFYHTAGNKFITLLFNMFHDTNFTDVETCYKMFKRELLQSFDLVENRFGFDPEITAQAVAKTSSIYEVGISYNQRWYGEGKKIGMRDAFRALFVIIKYAVKNKTKKNR